MPTHIYVKVSEKKERRKNTFLVVTLAFHLLHSQCSNCLKEQEGKLVDKRREICVFLDMYLEQWLKIRHNFHDMYNVYLPVACSANVRMYAPHVKKVHHVWTNNNDSIKQDAFFIWQYELLHFSTNKKKWKKRNSVIRKCIGHLSSAAPDMNTNGLIYSTNGTCVCVKMHAIRELWMCMQQSGFCLTVAWNRCWHIVSSKILFINGILDDRCCFIVRSWARQ